jgi:hypothetical protein
MIQIIIILGILAYFCYIFTNHSNNKKDEQISKEDIIKKLVRQSARWSTAARQDNSLMIKVLHACYGAGYLWALKDIASNDEIERYAKIDMFKFENEITSTMDAVQMKLASTCNKYPPKRSYLTSIAGEGM